ncbi:MAG: response regulator [Candidatus Methanoperedens sp.]|nr:response regulator [Candidatus Methanoperedens sp.]MCZ7371688.1 response regulator [Candidatus Methanoperedens sp.]
MNKLKILVVDDEPLNIEFMEGILSLEYEVVKAKSGIDGLIKAEKILPDIILLDIMMPNTNGYAVCKELRTNKKTAAIPIVMVTVLDGNEDKMKAIEAGADDFMSKPIDIGELRARVKSWLMVKRHYDNCLSSSNQHLYKVF